MAQAKHTEMVGLANMILDLRGVLEWNPEMADAFDLLALARNEGGGSAAALQSERSAVSLSPRNESYVYHLAEIYVASKKWDAAGTLLERLKASSNPQIAAQARNLLSQAGTERKYGIALNSSGGSQPKYEPQKSPFDVLEADAAKRSTAETTPQSGPGDSRATRFAKGRLIAVDCSTPPGATLTVNSEIGTLKLRAADYKSLVLIGADDFSCDWRDRQVTVNYKPSGGAGGDLVSLELR
jgi:tetratricopeptide (TPR) repeat protein